MSRTRFLLRGLLQLFVGAACVVGAVALVKFAIHPWIARTLSLEQGASGAVRRWGIFVAVVLSYWAFVRYYERRPVSELAPRAKWFLLALAAGSASIGVTILILYATGNYELVAFLGFARVASVMVTIWIAAFLEEVVFRGLLLRILEERLGTRTALAGSAAIFGILHMSNDGARTITLFSVTLAGLMWAGVFLISRNLWVAAAHHAAWNATIFLSGVPLSGEDWRASAPLETVYRGSTFWTGGVFGPEDSPVNIVLCLAICIALWRVALHLRQVKPWPEIPQPTASGTARADLPTPSHGAPR
ncbi:MAG: CPBP family intramembrane glutamic endopeptidase [Acidobacteriota bacterium]